MVEKMEAKAEEKGEGEEEVGMMKKEVGGEEEEKDDEEAEEGSDGVEGDEGGSALSSAVADAPFFVSVVGSAGFITPMSGTPIAGADAPPPSPPFCLSSIAQ